MASRHHRRPQNRVHEAEHHQHSPNGRTETRHKQLVTFAGDDWEAGPKGTMSLAEMIAAGFEVATGQSPEPAASPAAAANTGPPI
eukprot:12205276-Karenia_brevis.AAC.1